MFARDFLSGEGILSRHVGHLGLAVSHVQTPLDEFNFAVKNLAVDLRCGIRLVYVRFGCFHFTTYVNHI